MVDSNVVGGKIQWIACGIPLGLAIIGLTSHVGSVQNQQSSAAIARVNGANTNVSSLKFSHC
jgi:hypothetical protein